MEDRSKGYFYAIIAHVFFAIWGIFGTLGFHYYNFFTTTFLWFGFASIFSFFMILFSGKLNEYLLLKKHWKIIILTTTLNTLSVLSSWYALSVLGPSLMGFLQRISIIFTIIAGIIFLKEKFNFYEFIGIVVAIIGTVLITYSGGEYILKGVIGVLSFGIFYSLANLLIKSRLQLLDPLILVNVRVSSIAFYIMIISLIFGKFNFFFSKGLVFATVPSIFSAILGHLFMYKAFKKIEFSRVGIFAAFEAFLVLALSYIIFKEVLTLIQFTGGILIVAGILGVVYSKKLLNNKSIQEH